MNTIIAEAATTYNYDPRARQWVVANGSEIVRFPAGNLGKHQAQLYALNKDRPDLAALIYKTVGRNYDSKAIGMAIKSAQILIDELLYSDGFVQSQSRPGVLHQVTWSGIPRTYGCTCEAMQFCAIYIDGIGWLCKHGLADYFAHLLEIELPRQPIPFEGEPLINTLDYFEDF